ncbi:MAG: aromatic amino acid lyase [Pseudonocardiaceae bacterium]
MANLALLTTINAASRLEPEDLELVHKPLFVEFDEEIQSRIETAEQFVQKVVSQGRPVYGLTTGYGALVNYPSRVDHAAHGRGLIDFLTVGQGEPLRPEITRAMLLCRLLCLARGRSGVSPAVLVGLRAALATEFSPVVPEYGSVGASGDLVPLAHAAGALMGTGEVFVDGQRVSAGKALITLGLSPMSFAGRDALAFVNGISLSSAAAGLAAAQAKRSLLSGLALTAQLAEILGARAGFADADLARASGHRHIELAAHLLREFLAGGCFETSRSLQEPYSIRCAPQLLGAAWSAIEYSEKIISASLNGVSDNPLFFPELDKVAHGGNFFGQTIAFSTDLLNNVLTQLGNLAERQLDLLLDPQRNGGLPPLLAAEPGHQHGMTGVQISATSIVAAMRRYAMPSGMQSLPTNHYNQDVVPFGNQAALQALDQARRLRWIHGMVAVALRQAVYVGASAPISPRGSSLYERLVAAIPPVDPDRPLANDIQVAADELDEFTRAEARQITNSQDCHLAAHGT